MSASSNLVVPASASMVLMVACVPSKHRVRVRISLDALIKENEMNAYLDTLPLVNRYSYDIHLKFISDNDGVLKYQLFVDNVNYVRVISQENFDGILAIDPEGGPYISVGDKVYGYKVVRIIIENGNYLVYLGV